MATEVQGLNKWTRQVKRIPEAAKEGLRVAQGKNAEKLVSAMRAFVPVRRGKLKASIGWARGLPPSTAATGAFRLKAKDLTERQSVLASEGLLVSVYAGDNTAYYARFVEFGTKPAPAAGQRSWRREKVYDRRGVYRGQRMKASGRANKRPHAGTRAQPYFYPAIRANKDKIRRSNASAFSRSLRRAVAG